MELVSSFTAMPICSIFSMQVFYSHPVKREAFIGDL
jgi:hypothetical protein